MSTPTCSIFLPRNCLVPYLGGKYLLAANGPFVELFDIEKLRSGKYDSNEDVPCKTRVTERSTIYHILPLEKSGHIVVISSDKRHKCRTLTAHLIHRNEIVRGGYVMDDASYVLSREEEIRFADTTAEVIPNCDEFLLATCTLVTHVRFVFSSTGDIRDAKIFKEYFNPRNNMNTADRFIPCALSSSVPIKLFLKTEDSRLSLTFPALSPLRSSESMPRDDTCTVQIILTSLDFGIICGDKFITIVSTSAHKNFEGKNEMRKIVRFDNPYPSPKRICARENKDKKSALIVITSEYGISTWKCTNGNMVQISSLNGPEWTGKEPNKVSVQKYNQYIFDQSSNDLAGIVDAAVVPDAKIRNDFCDLVVSLKSGALVVFNIMNPAASPIGILTMTMDKCTIPIESIVPFYESEDDDALNGRMFAASEGRLAMVDLAEATVCVISKPVVNGRVVSSLTDDCETISVCYTPNSFTMFRSSLANQFGGEHQFEFPNCLISNRYVAFSGGKRMIVMELLAITDNNGQHTSQTNILFSDLIKEEEITAFHVQHTADPSTALGVFGTSIGRIFTAPLPSVTVDFSKIEMATVFKKGRMFEKVIDMKLNTTSGKLMVLGKEGQILLMTTDTLEDREERNMEAIQLKFVQHFEILGFMTIMAKKKQDRKDVIVVKEENQICLYDLPFLRQIFRINISKLDKPSYYAHYVGDAKKNRITMYVNGGYSVPPHVVRVDGLINSTTDNLANSTTLSHCVDQFSRSSRDIFLLGNKHCQYVVSIGTEAVECMRMNRKGTLCRISRGEVIGSKLETMKVTCSDVKYNSIENSVFALIGGEAGEVYMRVIDQMLTCRIDRIMHVEDSKIMSIRYFQDEFSRNSLSRYAVLTSSKIRVFTVQYFDKPDSLPTVKNLYDQEIPKGIEWKDYHMVTMGDGEVVHDVWLLSDNSVYLFIGRNQKKRKHVELKLTDWKGRITASCSMTTKKSLHDTYLDIITIAKGGRIGILAALHMDDNPADGILFTEWVVPPGSAVVGLHTELINVSEIESGHVLEVRLYVMKKKGSLHVYLGRVRVEGPKLSVDKVVEISKIYTSVHEPYQIAVSNLSKNKKTPNVEPPKYVIVSGTNGSQVVRICAEKLGGLDSIERSNYEQIQKDTVHYDIELD